MSETTGRAKVQGIHDYKHGDVFVLDDMLFNCHQCNKTFSPVRVKLKVSNHARYFRGVWARMCWILEVEEDKVCGCREFDVIMMYDNVDPVLRSRKEIQ